MIPILFRIDTSAILLPIEAHGLGRLDAILPADSIVIVQKLYAVMQTQFFTHFTDHLVVLITGIEKTGRERFVAGFCSIFCGLFEPRLVAVGTAIGWLCCHLGKKIFQQVFVFVDDLKLTGGGILFNGLKPSTILLVGMYVVIEEVACYQMSCLA